MPAGAVLMKWYITKQGWVQAPDDDRKNEMLELLKRLGIDVDKVANATLDTSDSGFTLSVQYMQPLFGEF